MSDWYFVFEGRENGPVQQKVLLEFLQRHSLDSVYVWKAGFENWQLAKDVPDLAFVTQPPSPPLVAERSLQKQTSDLEPKKNSRAKRWSQIGALIGLIFGALGLLGQVSSGREFSDHRDVGYVIGYLGASIILCTVIAFIAACVACLFRARAPSSSSGASFVTERRTWNFFRNHWRGLYPLWFAYWIIAVVGFLLILLLSILIKAIFALDRGFNPLSIFIGMALIWLSVVAVSVWQSVGVWRSATHYIGKKISEGRRGFWGGLAKLAVIVGCLNLIGTATKEALPQLREAYRIAFENDPDIPAYSMRVMRDGSEAEIVGGLKFGVADDFRKVLSASRGIKVVHLDSVGGRLGEGQKLFELIREQNLDTYVSSKCLSACTLAFAGGKERYLLKGATLGFHRGAFAGVAESTFDSEQARVFKQAGFSQSFIQTALSTPNKDMWQPTADVLLAAGVVTQTVDASRFAFSGVGTDFSKEKAAQALISAGETYVAIKDKYPQQFDGLVGDFYESVLKGKTLTEATTAIRARLLSLIRSLTPQADDDVIVDYTSLMIEQYRALSQKDASLCYAYVSGEGTQPDNASMPKALISRELAIQARIIRTSRARAKTPTELTDRLYSQVAQALQKKGATEEDFKLFQSNGLPKAQHRKYCLFAISFFQEIANLPRLDEAMLMRSIFAAIR